MLIERRGFRVLQKPNVGRTASAPIAARPFPGCGERRPDHREQGAGLLHLRCG